MFKVIAQINNGNPCPKRESRAWDYKEIEVATLADAISFLLENDASGFEIQSDGKVIAINIQSHY